jgi:precorrin-6Y C5,15-methyltransferase (decarboxylating)
MSITLIGIDDSGQLSESLTAEIKESDVLAGGERHLAFFPDFKGETYTIKGKLVELSKFLEARADKKITVLASGDPLFFGIGAYLAKKIGAENITVEPAVSSMQLAFARAKISWQEAALISVHGKPLGNLDGPCQSAKVIGIFTDAEHSPQAIAKYVAEKSYGEFDCWVCQNLGGPEEKVWKGYLSETGTQTFSDLNVVILQKRESDEVSQLDLAKLPLFGIDDNLFNYRAPSKGLITKKEVRVVSLSQMFLKKDSLVWDLGAGSGSVSVECARLCPEGQVFCIDKNNLDYEYIAKNLKRFGVSNVTAVHGLAPEDIPESWGIPDVVFVGGSSGSMKELVEKVFALQKSGGRMVVNAITLDNQALAYSALKEVGYEVQVQQVNVSRSKPILDMLRFEALNPINIYTGVKK